MTAFGRLFRGETHFEFAARWQRWFAISGTVILVGLISLGIRGLDFSIDFKGGTVWQVPSSASVADIRSAIGGISANLDQATITSLTDRESGTRQIKVEAPAKETANAAEVARVTDELATISHVPANDVQLNDIGPSWGSDITDKAVRAVIVFLVVVTAGIWLRFELKMAIAALVALVHDILVTVGLYSLSGFQVSPDTVIAFLTILGYSLYDTIVVFDKVQENTKGLASTGRLTYSDTVNLSMNQVLARSLNTSLVAIIPILSILVIGAGFLGASALEDFGLALFVGLATGAYSSIFVASPLLALLKEREPRYAQIRDRLAKRPPSRLTPKAAALAPRADEDEATAGKARPSRVSPTGKPRPPETVGKRAGTTEEDDGGVRPGSTRTTAATRSTVQRTRRVRGERPVGVEADDEPEGDGETDAASAGDQTTAPRERTPPKARPGGSPPGRPAPRPRKKRRR